MKHSSYLTILDARQLGLLLDNFTEGEKVVTTEELQDLHRGLLYMHHFFSQQKLSPLSFYFAHQEERVERMIETRRS